MTDRAQVDAALALASDEVGLQTYYRDCVRPLLTMPETQWPRCCGGGCEPCNEVLVTVATRVKALLAAGGAGAAPKKKGDAEP